MVARKTAWLWDRFAAVDPGLMRLASAMRAVLGAAASLAVLAALRQSDTDLLVGGFTAMVTSLAISDLHPRNQLITLGLGAPLSLTALTAGAVLTPYPVAARIVFLLLIYVAVHVRRYGPRGQGLGIFGFMAFFLSQFTGARAAQLPQMGAAVLVAFGAVAAVWYGPGFMTGARVLVRLRRTFDGRLRDVLRDMATLLSAGQDDDTVSQSLERRLDRLHTAVLLIEDFLDEHVVDEATDSCLLRHLSRVEVAAQRLAVLTVRAVHTSLAVDDLAGRTARQQLAGRIRLLHHQVALGTAFAPEAQAVAPEAERSIRPGERTPVQDCFQAVDDLAMAVSSLGPGRVSSPTRPGPAPQEPTARRVRAFDVKRYWKADDADRKRGTTRQAVQVTVASALSVFGGHLLSPDHWYWAVAATWVVFINTESTGEVLLQSVRRLAGTVLGVVFGYGLATLVGPDGSLLLALLLVCMFGMFYTPSDAYWAVTFFITGMLSMLLALLDTFSTDVLVLRVQETALGVSCGVLAAVLVLPVTVRRASDEELVDFLLALRRLLHETTRIPGTGTKTSLVRATHDLDQALESFRRACLPLTHPLNLQRGRRDRARHLLELLEAGAYHARSLAAVAGRLPESDGIEYAPRIADAADRVQETVTHLIRVTRHRRGTAPRTARPRVTRALSLLSDEQRMRRGRPSPEQRLLLHIGRLDTTLTALVRAWDPPVPGVGHTVVSSGGGDVSSPPSQATPAADQIPPADTHTHPSVRPCRAGRATGVTEPATSPGRAAC
ncbi:FUSC family protein [Streptomyces yaanensis]|uniref:FUSC family protein n=1 Tax=Streptomyces yaanensis TaxID=1142239 RepID=A0ABV7SE54_9ACTN|nr:FUSC family protein [Streptomyces sp. CGMCC 4.7035]WNB98633.1 FUSC family protein [Streptomyces sp. CGMCC 4.7035]